MTRPIIKKNRTLAFEKQSGLCYYCGYPMLRTPSSSKKRSPFLCTAEHLQAMSEGGSNLVSNIVAACWFCNSRRHRTKKVRLPAEYKAYVQLKIKCSRWHQKKLPVSLSLGIRPTPP